MNQIEIAGHLGAEPETRFTASGQKVTTLRVAARSRKGNQEDTIWWRVTIWGDRFDKMMNYLKKGSAVIVLGEMQKPEIFTNRDGAPQVAMEMTAVNIRFSPFGGGNNNRQEQGQQSYQPAGMSSAPAADHADHGAPISDDDIPF